MAIGVEYYESYGKSHYVYTSLDDEVDEDYGIHAYWREGGRIIYVCNWACAWGWWIQLFRYGSGWWQRRRRGGYCIICRNNVT